MSFITAALLTIFQPNIEPQHYIYSLYGINSYGATAVEACELRNNESSVYTYIFSDNKCYRKDGDFIVARPVLARKGDVDEHRYKNQY